MPPNRRRQATYFTVQENWARPSRWRQPSNGPEEQHLPRNGANRHLFFARDPCDDRGETLAETDVFAFGTDLPDPSAVDCRVIDGPLRFIASRPPGEPKWHLEWVVGAFLSLDGLKPVEETDTHLAHYQDITHLPFVFREDWPTIVLDVLEEHKTLIPNDIKKYEFVATWNAPIIKADSDGYIDMDNMTIWDVWARFKTSVLQRSDMAQLIELRRSGVLAKIWKAKHIELIFLIEKEDRFGELPDLVDDCPEVLDTATLSSPNGWSIYAIKLEHIARELEPEESSAD